MVSYIFVYGTLLGEFAPPEIAVVITKLELIGAGFVHGRLYDLGDYPGAILDASSETKIFGRVYRLPSDSDILNALDDYEEFHPHKSSQSLFIRKQTEAFLTSGEKIRCWVYEYNRNISFVSLIESGDYSKVTA